MKMNIHILFVFLLFTGCSTGQNGPQSSLQPSPHDLVFTELASSWDEGIPLGNGIMGALVWEKEGRLRIALDRADLWDLRPMENVYKEGLNYAWVYKNWEENSYRKVQQAFDVPYDQAAGPSKIPVAALELPLDEFGPVESVRLFTHHGLCRIQWETASSWSCLWIRKIRWGGSES